MTEREAFEEWWASKYPHSRFELRPGNYPGIYDRLEANTAWEAWQARAALEKLLLDEIEKQLHAMEGMCLDGVLVGVGGLQKLRDRLSPKSNISLDAEKPIP